MYKTESQAVNGGNLAPGLAVIFDLPIGGRWCKVVAINIVQKTVGAMNIGFEIWESTTAQGDPTNRDLLYERALFRNISFAADEGGQYIEAIDQPLPYFDRDAVDEERTYRIHCRLENHGDGTSSDFDVSLTVADMGERV